MINGILDGITAKLHKVFGFTIYTDHIEQGFTEPCFYVTEYNTVRQQEIEEKSKRNMHYEICFFPKETSQINTVAQKFLDEFSEVTLTDGTMVAGFDLHTETVDRVLHCYVKYSVFLRRERAPVDTMEDLKVIANGNNKKRR